MNKENNENQRPSKMIGVLFPKAKYGVIVAIIIIIGGNLLYYKEAIFSLRWTRKCFDTIQLRTYEFWGAQGSERLHKNR